MKKEKEKEKRKEKKKEKRKEKIKEKRKKKEKKRKRRVGRHAKTCAIIFECGIKCAGTVTHMHFSDEGGCNQLLL